MEVHLCANNIAVKYVLSLHEEKSGGKTVVITDQKNIYAFFDFLKNDSILVYYIDSTIQTWNIVKLLKSKKNVKNLFKELNEIQRVHFYHQAFGGFYNWIITYSHKRGIPIIFHRSVRPLDMPKANLSIRFVLTKIVYNLYYNAQVDLLQNGVGISPKLSRHFYEKNDIKEECEELSTTQLQKVSQIIGRKIGLKDDGNNVLVLTGSVMASGQVDMEEYQKKMIKLLEHLGKYRIICKCHPRYADETDEEKKQYHIEYFVPINLLLPFFRAVIGYNSFTLVEAAQLGKKSYSLLNYFKPTNESRKKVGVDYLKKGDVLFPTDLSEIII